MALSVNWTYVCPVLQNISIISIFCAHSIDKCFVGECDAPPVAEILPKDDLPFIACITRATAARSAVPPCKAGM